MLLCLMSRGLLQASPEDDRRVDWMSVERCQNNGGELSGVRRPGRRRRWVAKASVDGRAPGWATVPANRAPGCRSSGIAPARPQETRMRP